MVTKIIACADLHVPQYNGIKQLSEALKDFIQQSAKIVEENGSEATRIVVAGDIFHNKITITNESIMLASWFLGELGKLCKTYVIAGNHDYIVENESRMDSLTPIFEIAHYDNVVYLDKEFEFKSGCFVDDNITFALYSIFDSFNTPPTVQFKEQYPDNFIVGLVHHEITGAITSTNHISEAGLSPCVFSDCEFVIAGHIHKHQEIKQDGVKIVYCSSITQKNMGESITGHGFVLWSCDEDGFWDYELREVADPLGGYYKFAITGISDIENDNEELINL